jgi:hypothetical protein
MVRPREFRSRLGWRAAGFVIEGTGYSWGPLANARAVDGGRGAGEPLANARGSETASGGADGPLANARGSVSALGASGTDVVIGTCGVDGVSAAERTASTTCWVLRGNPP